MTSSASCTCATSWPGPTARRLATVGDLTRDLHRLPGSKRLLAALSEMRRAGDHVALVVDEYGGTAGHRHPRGPDRGARRRNPRRVRRRPDRRRRMAATEVEGLLNLNDFAQRTGMVLPAGPYDTVGGYVMSALGRLPQVGDQVPVPSNGPSPGCSQCPRWTDGGWPGSRSPAAEVAAEPLRRRSTWCLASRPSDLRAPCENGAHVRSPPRALRHPADGRLVPPRQLPGRPAQLGGAAGHPRRLLLRGRPARDHRRP